MSSRSSWILIHESARGDAQAKEALAARYAAPLHAYFAARWKGHPLTVDVDDAAQEVFVRCFGAADELARNASGIAAGFRAFLFGIARNVAREFETRRERGTSSTRESALDGLPGREKRASAIFDQAWATEIMRQAKARMIEQAESAGGGALERVELLALRFEEGLPIRDIAARRGQDPALVHRAYARARDEFRQALREVVGLYVEGPAMAVERECEALLGLLA